MVWQAVRFFFMLLNVLKKGSSHLLQPTVAVGAINCHGWLHQVPRLMAPTMALGNGLKNSLLYRLF